VGTRSFYGIDAQGLEAVRGYLDAFWDVVLGGFTDTLPAADLGSTQT
jgi:hypothetical protein